MPNFLLKIIYSIVFVFCCNSAICQTYQYYFGNIHAHSGYSDGNVDASTSLRSVPGQDFAYAKESYNFNFLGISEHNHSGAGMQLADYDRGKYQADTSNVDGQFVCMYGMEYGVISAGGPPGTLYMWTFQTLLAKGYKLGPTIDHDNHYTTFGRTAHSRTVVLSQALNRDSIMAAYKAMRFYASNSNSNSLSYTHIIPEGDTYYYYLEITQVDGLNISITSSKTENLRISIYDEEGRLQKRITSNISSGENIISQNIAALASGTYRAVINTTNLQLEKLFIKL